MSVEAARNYAASPPRDARTLARSRPEPEPAMGRKQRLGHDLAMRTFSIRSLCPALIVSLAVLLSGALAPAQAQMPSGPQPTLPLVTLQAGIHRIQAELANTPQARQTGLMHRKSLAPNHGMLFSFEQKAGHCFWMRNTLIPLSIAFLDDDGSIVNIAHMEPESEQSHCPAKPVRFALEMEHGWFGKRGLEAGSKLVNRELFESARRN
jgi:uncharacterized membrane protein (UPF0127 family)